VSDQQAVVIATPDDWHVHLRDDAMLAAVAPYTASIFRYALVMPNLTKPITSTAAAARYRQRIIEAAGPTAGAEFTPLMTLYLNDEVSADDLIIGHDEAIIHAAKYYPSGATTNSEAGVENMGSLLPVLERMAEAGVPLLVHAESIDPSVDIFDRERDFLENQLHDVCDRLPELRVTVEHVSTADGIDFVREHRGVAATITPHHLSCDRGDVLSNGLRPDLYCKPVLNSRADRQALVAAATGGDPAFFLGTDSAPHPETSKLSSRGKPGIFNAPYAIPVVAEVFAQADRLDRLEGFVSVNGAGHYGFAPAHGRIEIRPNPAGPPSPTKVIDGAAGEVRIFGAEAAAKWLISRRSGRPPLQ